MIEDYYFGQKEDKYMTENIIKNKYWQIGIVLFVIGTILWGTFSLFYESIELIFGIILVIIGIILLYQVCTEKPIY